MMKTHQLRTCLLHMRSIHSLREMSRPIGETLTWDNPDILP